MKAKEKVAQNLILDFTVLTGSSVGCGCSTGFTSIEIGGFTNPEFIDSLKLFSKSLADFIILVCKTGCVCSRLFPQ